MFFKRRNRVFCACRHLGGGGRLLSNLSDKNGLSSAFQSGQNAAQNLTPQEQLLAGTLELDPENDPVVFTTDYGLEIKSHNANGAPDASITDTNQNDPITVSGTTWNYISVGGYNWIIIGSYSESSYTISTIRGDEYSGSNPDGTDAGYESECAGTNGLLKINPITIPAFSNAKEGYNGEIPIGCVLCLCAGNITTTQFNASTSSGNNYSGSDLEDYMNNTVYGSDSELSIGLQGLSIVPQKLTTLYAASEPSIIENAYVFPLAARDNTESFYVGSYLDSDGKRDIDALWWLRSGGASNSSYAYIVGASGSVSINVFSVAYPLGVRPAFVLQLYSA